MSAAPIPDLGQLIAEGRGEGTAVVVSYRDLAIAAGNSPTATRFHQLRTRGIVNPDTGTSKLSNWPEVRSVPGIAQALGYSDWSVIRSAAVSLGFTPPPDPADIPLLARLSRLSLEELSPSEVDAIVTMAKALLATRSSI